MTDVVAAVDAGGTKCLGALVTARGATLDERQVPTPRRRAACDPDLACVLSLTGHLFRRAVEAGHRVVGVALGFPEYVKDGHLTSNEVFGWTTQPGDLVRSAWPAQRVTVDSDVRCAARAEARLGAAKGFPTVVYVSWGTGISSALVVDGEPLVGRRGEALALGEFGVPSSVDPAWTGNLEAFASGRGIAERFARLRRDHAAGAHADAHAVTLLAEAGDPDAVRVTRSAARALAYAIRDCVSFVDPSLVVLGGGIGVGEGLLAGTLRATLSTILTRPDPPPVLPARLGGRAGVVGAALLAWERWNLGRPGPRRSPATPLPT